jgi:hypothetical protein
MKRYRGHYPGHLQDAFLEAMEAYRNWETGEPEPTVEISIQYDPVQIPISKIFGKLWFCTDILPGIDFDSLEYVDIYPKTRTYAAAAHALLAAMRKEQPKPENE